MQALFDFHYRIEVYTPLASKERRYGYYVMPILHHGRLVGRLDPKADRRAHALILHAVYLEPGVVPDDELVVALATAIREFAEFHRCTTIRIDRSDPPELRDLLLRECG